MITGSQKRHCKKRVLLFNMAVSKVCLLILATFTATSFSQGAEKCKSSSGHVECTNITTGKDVVDASNYIRTLKNIEHITLEQCNVRLLTKAFFEIKGSSNMKAFKYTNITFSACDMEKIPYELIGPCCDSLKSLAVLNSSVQDTSIPGDHFKCFEKLEHLSIVRSGIKTIMPEAIKRLSNLRTLNFSGNKLASLSKETFAGLDMLTKLDLSNNTLKSLDDGIFDGITNIEELNLLNNQLQCNSSLLWLKDWIYNRVTQKPHFSYIYNCVPCSDWRETHACITPHQIVEKYTKKLTNVLDNLIANNDTFLDENMESKLHSLINSKNDTLSQFAKHPEKKKFQK